jgi:hypothetical protein
MRIHPKTATSAGALGAGVAAVTLLIPMLLAAVLPAKSDALVPLALMLPCVTMGLLDAAVSNDGHAPS